MRKHPPHKYHFDESNSSDKYVSDSYQDVLMSSLVALSNQRAHIHSHETDEIKPTESRIEFVKNILDGNRLKPMVNFDNCDTESSANTRLNKKIFGCQTIVRIYEC